MNQPDTGQSGPSGAGQAPGTGAARRNKRRRQQNRPRGGELWRPVPQLPDPEPIVPASDPGILLRSLGSPPLQGQGSQAEHAFELVVRRSAMLASALAAAAGLLEEPDTD